MGMITIYYGNNSLLLQYLASTPKRKSGTLKYSLTSLVIRCYFVI